MNVFITRKIPEAGLNILKEAGCHIIEHTEQRPLTPEELIGHCKKADAVLIAGHTIIDEFFLNECDHLKVIGLMSVGYEHVNLPAATALKIPISNTPGVLSKATSDIAFLLMLAVSRKAFFMHRQILEGKWNFFEPTANLGIELYGKTLGIFGLGKIGLELAKKCRAVFDMNIIYHNRSNNKEAEKLVNAQYVSLDELLKNSDVLSLHANLTNETMGRFNLELFRKMKPSAIFINTGRGGLHNETDLLYALQNHLIWGAGLDVTNPEPMAPDHPLLTMPNVCIVPHIGSATVETRDAMAKMAAVNIVAGLEGKPIPNIVNTEIYS